MRSLLTKLIRLNGVSARGVENYSSNIVKLASCRRFSSFGRGEGEQRRDVPVSKMKYRTIFCDSTSRLSYRRPPTPAPHRHTPELIYIPRLLRWLKIKMKLRKLKQLDKDFSEGAFIYGALGALCRVTEIIRDDATEELTDLLTDDARSKLLYVMNRKLTQTQKEMIALRMSDFKILVPVNVECNDKNDKKYNLKNGKRCKLSVRGLALKWFEKGGVLKLILVALEAEFSRDYDKNARPDWIISNFDVLECAMLNEIAKR